MANIVQKITSALTSAPTSETLFRQAGDADAQAVAASVAADEARGEARAALLAGADPSAFERKAEGEEAKARTYRTRTKTLRTEAERVRAEEEAAAHADALKAARADITARVGAMQKAEAKAVSALTGLSQSLADREEVVSELSKAERTLRALGEESDAPPFYLEKVEDLARQKLGGGFHSFDVKIPRPPAAETVGSIMREAVAS
jgi:hypothetical protein